MKRKYPTPKQILAKIKKNPPDMVPVAMLTYWKQQYYNKKWSKLTDQEKCNLIEWIILEIHQWYEAFGNRRCLDFKWNQPEWSYNPRTHTINAPSTYPSIISALHELGHALLGNDELFACAFSVGLFKECFPEAYKQLTWKGHLLVKK